MKQARRAEVLRYLGYVGQPIDAAFEGQLARAMALCEAVSRPRAIHGLFAEPSLQLPSAKKTIIFAATLGHEIGREIDAWQRRDMSFAAMLDAAATEMIERLCDEIEAEIGASLEGLFAAPRVSPGYGELPLALNETILHMLDAGRKIGLYATPSLMLAPQKSVTAMVGLHATPVHNGRGCEVCANQGSCPYRHIPNREEDTPNHETV